MNVSLTPELEGFVRSRSSGAATNSASEVIREALQLLEEQEQVRHAQLTAFRSEIDRRVAALDGGERADPPRCARRSEDGPKPGVNARDDGVRVRLHAGTISRPVGVHCQ